MLGFDLLSLNDTSDFDKIYGVGQHHTTAETAAAEEIKKAEAVANKEDDMNRKVGIIGVNLDLGISIYEAKLRIFDCCEELGISTDTGVLYSDVQALYRDKHKISLNKDELKKLFKTQKAKTAISDNFCGELIWEAENDADGMSQKIKLCSGKNIHDIISRLEEMTALDKIGREEDAAEVETISVTVAPPQEPKTFKKPVRLLSNNFKIVDCRFSNSMKKKSLGFHDGNGQLTASDGSAPLRHILDNIKHTTTTIPKIQDDEDYDLEALWKEQLAESERLARERFEARKGETEAKNKQKSDHQLNSSVAGGEGVPSTEIVEPLLPFIVADEPDSVKNLVPQDVVCNEFNESMPQSLPDVGIFSDSAELELSEPWRPVPPPRKFTNLVTTSTSTIVTPVTTAAIVNDNIKFKPVVPPRKPVTSMTVEANLVDSVILSGVSTEVFDSNTEKPIVPPRKPVTSVHSNLASPASTFVHSINTPETNVDQKLPVFKPKASARPLNTVVAKPRWHYLDSTSPVTDHSINHPVVNPLAECSSVCSLKHAHFLPVNQPSEFFPLSPTSTSAFQSISTTRVSTHHSTNVIKPIPTTPDKFTVKPTTTDSPQSFKSTNCSSKTGMTIIYVPPNSGSSNPVLAYGGVEIYNDARQRLQFITEDIAKTFQKATEEVDCFIDNVLKAEEEEIAAIRKRNNDLVMRFKAKMEAKLEKKLKKKLEEQERLTKFCKLTNPN